MKFLTRKIFITILSVFTLTQLVDKVVISDGWNGIFYAALTLSALNFIIRPILTIIFFPLNLATLNLSSWVVEILIIYIWTVITPVVKIGDWQWISISFTPWQMIIVSAILLTLTSKFYKWLIG